MIFIGKPKYSNQELNVEQVIDACLPIKDYVEEDYGRLASKTVKSAQRKKRIQSYISTITRMERKYNNKARTASLWELQDILNTEEVTKKQSFNVDLVDYLYKERFCVKSKEGKKPPRQEEYRCTIKRQASGICPYCGKPEDTSSFRIDHFLPKSEYPVFALTPVNLVPCCSECNEKKGRKIPWRIPGGSTHGIVNSKDNYVQLPHPYYDNFGDVVWIKADLKEVKIDETSSEYSFEFYSYRPDNWSDAKYTEIYTRCSEHFEFFGLKERFREDSAVEIKDIREKAMKFCKCSANYDVFYDCAKLYYESNCDALSSSGENGWRKVCRRALFDTNNEACTSFWKGIWKKAHPA